MRSSSSIRSLNITCRNHYGPIYTPSSFDGLEKCSQARSTALLFTTNAIRNPLPKTARTNNQYAFAQLYSVGLEKSFWCDGNQFQSRLANEGFGFHGCYLSGWDTQQSKVVSFVCLQNRYCDLFVCVNSHRHLSTLTNNVIIGDYVTEFGNKETRTCGDFLSSGLLANCSGWDCFSSLDKHSVCEVSQSLFQQHS